MASTPHVTVFEVGHGILSDFQTSQRRFDGMKYFASRYCLVDLITCITAGAMSRCRSDPTPTWFGPRIRALRGWRIGHRLIASGVHAWRVVTVVGAQHMPASSADVQTTDGNQESDRLDNTREKRTTTMNCVQCADIRTVYLNHQKEPPSLVAMILWRDLLSMTSNGY